MEIVKQQRESLTDGMVQPMSPVHGDLDFENVSFQYGDGKNEVLKGITFGVKGLGNRWLCLVLQDRGRLLWSTCFLAFHEYTDGHILLDAKELEDYPRISA